MTAEPLFDFDKGEFVFDRGGSVRLVTGQEGLKNWIRKILHTPLGRYRIYGDSGYGNRLEDLLIGKTLPREYLIAEAERIVKETILQHEDVQAVDSFDISIDGSRLTVAFRVQSVYGSMDIDDRMEAV